MEVSTKVIKETFNKLSKQHKRKFAYKRCIKNSKKVIMFEAHHKTNYVFVSFYGFKLLTYNKAKEIAVWSCDSNEIELMIKYNLKKTK